MIANFTVYCLVVGDLIRGVINIIQIRIQQLTPGDGETYWTAGLCVFLFGERGLVSSFARQFHVIRWKLLLLYGGSSICGLMCVGTKCPKGWTVPVTKLLS